MQISLNHDQLQKIQSRYVKNINDKASNDYAQADLYYQIHKLVSSEGFGSFLTRYFNYNPEKIKRAELWSQSIALITSRRTWMRVGGFDGIQKIINIKDEDKRNIVLERVRKPKGMVNYTLTDLDRLIKSDSLTDGDITFFESPESKPQRNNHQGRKTRVTDNQLRKAVAKRVDQILKGNGRKKRRKRQPELV